MQSWFSKNFKTLIISAFLIPILTVAVVSISHVTQWYGISNPISWAIYLSIGIEIAALSALAAISANLGRKVYLPFTIVTLIQFIGNIYFAYTFIDVNSLHFKSWVDLVSPLLEWVGVDPTDMVGHKRFLAFFAGGMLPIISLSFLHMLVKFQQQSVTETPSPEVKEPVIDAKDLMGEISKVRLTEEDFNMIEKFLNKNKNNNEEKKPTEIEILNEEPDFDFDDEEDTNEYLKDENPLPVSKNIEIVEEEEPLTFDFLEEPEQTEKKIEEPIQNTIVETSPIVEEPPIEQVEPQEEQIPTPIETTEEIETSEIAQSEETIQLEEPVIETVVQEQPIQVVEEPVSEIPQETTIVPLSESTDEEKKN